MKVLIVDDHPVMRDGLIALLQRANPDADVLQARDAREALALADTHDVLDVILLDLRLPEQDGLEALPEFARRWPNVPILVLSVSEDPQDVRRSLALGASGYVPKSASQQVLLSAVRLVMDGERYVPPLILEEGSLQAGQFRDADAKGSALTERQIEILQLLSRGMPNKAIASALDLSEKTVKVHVSAIFKALNVVNRTQAAAAGRKAGIIR